MRLKLLGLALISLLLLSAISVQAHAYSTELPGSPPVISVSPSTETYANTNQQVPVSVTILSAPAGSAFSYSWVVAQGDLCPGFTSSTSPSFSYTPSGITSDCAFTVTVTDVADGDVTTASATTATIIVFAPTTFATVSCVLTGSTIPLGDCILAAVPIAFIGILISLLLVAITYMIGNVMNFTGLKNWYTSELKETVKSALIIAVIFSVLIIFSSIAATYAGPAQGTLAGGVSAGTEITNNIASMYTAIETNYLAPEIQDATISYLQLFGVATGVGILKTLFISLYVPIPVPPFALVEGAISTGVVFAPYQSNIIDSANDKAGSFLADAYYIISVPMLIILAAQYDLLYSIIVVGLGIMIPVGIVLRAIPFLRPLGATFLALGIGAAIVYPALLLAVNLPVTSYLAPPTLFPSSASTSCPFAQSGSGGNVGTQLEDLTICTAYGVTTGVLDSLVSSAYTFYEIGLGTAAGLLSFSSIYPSFNLVLSPAFINLVVQFILFVIDLIIGVVIVQNIASVLGGTVSFGVGRLKLV